MKKFVVITVILLMMVMAISGCGKSQSESAENEPTPQQNEVTQNPEGEQALEDGVYNAEAADFDDHGWKAIATVVVKDGKITNVFFDEINQEGLLKSFDTEYANNMKAKSGTIPFEAQVSLSASLIEKQNIESVDAVTGATHTAESFKALVNEALSGKPVEAKGTYKDGLYKSMDKDFDDHGWKSMAAVVVKDGKIVSAFFDQINKEDGHYKSTDIEYAKNMEAKANMTPNKASEMLINSLVEKQDVSAVEAVAGATHSSDSFKALLDTALSYAK